MTKYNTGNPVGSSSPLDLHDNAENLDAGINGSGHTWVDRKGAVRKSWVGIEYDFQVFLADGSTIEFPTWAAAAAAAGAGQIPANRQVAVVGDTGTHIDPVSGLEVSNSGRYVNGPAGLEWRSADVLSQKLDTAQVPVVQDETRQSVGVTQTRSGTGAGAVEVVMDKDGVARVVAIYPDGDGEPQFNGSTPNAWKAAQFGIDQVVESQMTSDPDRVEVIMAADGQLRVLQAFGSSLSGPVVFGASGSGPMPPRPGKPTEFVLLLIAGQSNAQGIGSRLLSPAVAEGVAYQYYGGSLSYATADPIGNADTGSAWPAFANEFYNRTGLGVIFVPAASGNSALTVAASAPEVGGSGQNWTSSTGLRSVAAARVQAAMSAATAAGLAWRFGGVLWSQGERDARCLPNAVSNPGVISEQEYSDALSALISYFNGQFGDSKWPFLLSVTGGDDEGIDADALESMRALQRSISRSHAQVRVGWTGAFNLIARGLMRKHDFPGDTSSRNRSHYSQQGYDEMGAAMATVASVSSI